MSLAHIVHVSPAQEMARATECSVSREHSRLHSRGPKPRVRVMRGDGEVLSVRDRRGREADPSLSGENRSAEAGTSFDSSHGWPSRIVLRRAAGGRHAQHVLHSQSTSTDCGLAPNTLGSTVIRSRSSLSFIRPICRSGSPTLSSLTATRFLPTGSSSPLPPSAGDSPLVLPGALLAVSDAGWRMIAPRPCAPTRFHRKRTDSTENGGNSIPRVLS